MTMRKAFAIMLTFIMVLGVFPIAHADSEIPDGYIPIYTAEDLSNIRNKLDNKYILMNNINLSDYGTWEAVGEYEKPFCGELNGDGYSIIGLSGEESLLGKIENATIKNLGIVNCNIVQSEENAGFSSYAGSFATSALNSTFDSCFATGKIQGCIRVGFLTVVSYCKIGGLVGESDTCSFINCYNDTDIHLSYDKISSAEIGGLIGEGYNTNLECCYNSGNITSENINNYGAESLNVHKGGLIGLTDELTVFKYCYYKDSVIAAVGKTQTNPLGTKNLSDTEMKTPNSFKGFDFESCWEISNGYPVLKVNRTTIKREINLNYKDSLSVFENENSKIISQETSNENVAFITEDGKIYGAGIGTATITVKTSDNQTEELIVTVSYSLWQKIIVCLFFGWIWY